MAIGDYVRNAKIMSGGLPAVRKNTPTQYAGRQKQHLAAETAAFNQQNAQWASDYFEVQVQGLDADDFYAWQTQLVRMSDITNPAVRGAKGVDDLKQVLFANPAVDYIPKGAKLVAAGSTWLVTNPQNISSAVATTVIEKCNAVWRHLDCYGNILSEPISIQKTLSASSGNEKTPFTLLTQGTFDVKAQYNEYTAELRQNSRIILGSNAYVLHGVTDFIQEFTGDDDSVHMMEFTAVYAEPNETDDLVNKVAGGLAFSWEISITGAAAMSTGATAQFSASSIRNGEAVSSATAHPISYIWSSSDESVATVNNAGLVTAVAEGEAMISATLAQNNTKNATFALAVSSSAEHIAFTSTPPESISIYGSATLTAAYFSDGAETEDTVDWSFSGAAENRYTAVVDGNAVTITCWGASAEPLVVTATCREESVSASMELIGL